MVKQGAADAAVRRLCSTLDKVIGHIITRTFYLPDARTSFYILCIRVQCPTGLQTLLAFFGKEKEANTLLPLLCYKF
jgi:hypothetical protein